MSDRDSDADAARDHEQRDHERRDHGGRQRSDRERRLDGCVAVVTRERPGELGRLLDEAGAAVVHVPLIGVVDAEGGALAAALESLAAFDWLIVTSPAGAERVGAAAANAPGVRLGAVGTGTAARLSAVAGRPVDLVPECQTAASLAAEFVRVHPAGEQRILLALGDRANATLHDGLDDGRNDVTTVVAYRTALRRPTEAEIMAIDGADAVLFASGSAAQGWVDALGDRAPALLAPLVIAIGPTTAAAAAGVGLEVTAVAADHSLGGLVEALADRWCNRRAT